MHMKKLRRLLVAVASLMVLMLAFTPASFAGGCDPDEEDCDGGDSGAAGGAVGTGFGGMASADQGDVLLTFALASGGVLLITAGGIAVRRKNH
jgi:hypothetical protein